MPLPEVGMSQTVLPNQALLCTPGTLLVLNWHPAPATRTECHPQTGILHPTLHLRMSGPFPGCRCGKISSSRGLSHPQNPLPLLLPPFPPPLPFPPACRKSWNSRMIWDGKGPSRPLSFTSCPGVPLSFLLLLQRVKVRGKLMD